MTRNETFAKAIKDRINGNKNHGWGSDDSTEVIMAMIASEVGEKPDDEFASFVKAVVNPSQFRQALEKKGTLNKSENRRSGVLKSLMSEIEL